MVLTNSNNNAVYHAGYKYNSVTSLDGVGVMHGVKRVVMFCIMTTVLPTILIITPLYLRHSTFADVTISVAESDVVAVVDGMSSTFCSSQTLRMNSSFHAFQLNGTPELSQKRKHIRLKKSMVLPDDTLEYWGFYLLRGATVKLKVCSRYEGSRILVVRGERNLRTCGLMEHKLAKIGATYDEEHSQVKVTYETAAQEIVDVEEKTGEVNAAVEDTSDVEESNVLVKDHRLRRPKKRKFPVEERNNSEEEGAGVDEKRHSRKKFLEMQYQLYKMQHSLKSNEEIDMRISRQARNAHTQQLDAGIGHGGNAMNYSHIDSAESSVSSFETTLLQCYDGQILLTESFAPSSKCTDVHYLEKADHMVAEHNVLSDGYYYYIFYSDNDFVSNDIHAVFDIYKPTYQYGNSTRAKKCLNSTECTFDVRFWGDETVFVEVPTRDGIEHEDDDITFLVSTCHPRMSVYIVFPVSVLVLILGCAFL